MGSWKSTVAHSFYKKGRSIMHFRSLLTVNLPAVTPDPEWEKDISKAIEELHSLQPQPGIIPSCWLR